MTFNTSMLSQEMHSAYMNAIYKIDFNNQTLQFKINQDCPDVWNTLKQFGVIHAGLITAWNPFSNPSCLTENIKANLCLENDIRASGLSYFPASGCDPDGHWEQEDGFCVFGVSHTQFNEWIIKYQQYAGLWLTFNQKPQLAFHPKLLFFPRVIGTPLSPSATKVMLLGSGELGKEVIIALQRFGVEVIAVDRYPNSSSGTPFLCHSNDKSSSTTRHH
jgi:hypothetical protein